MTDGILLKVLAEWNAYRVRLIKHPGEQVEIGFKIGNTEHRLSKEEALLWASQLKLAAESAAELDEVNPDKHNWLMDFCTKCGANFNTLAAGEFCKNSLPDTGHVWHVRMGLICCTKCGICWSIRGNKPCKGVLAPITHR